MAITLIKGRRAGLNTIEAVLQGRRPKADLVSAQEAVLDDLVAVGLSDGFRPHPVLALMLRQHFEPGDRVQVVKPLAARYHCAPGDLGTIAKVCPAGGCHDQTPDDDLYFVDLDDPKTEKTRVYLTFKELKKHG